jgi:hypothetical protein
MAAKGNRKDDLAALLREEAEAVEANPDAPITQSTNVTRGKSRSKTLQVRLNPDEFQELESLADSRGLPTSTVAREAILRLVRPDMYRSAVASRLVDEFAHYIDSFDQVRDNYHRGVADPGTSEAATKQKASEPDLRFSGLSARRVEMLSAIEALDPSVWNSLGPIEGQTNRAADHAFQVPAYSSPTDTRRRGAWVAAVQHCPAGGSGRSREERKSV